MEGELFVWTTEVSIHPNWQLLFLTQKCFLSSAGRSSISLQDLLYFVTGVQELPAAGFLPPPTISFLHPIAAAQQEDGEVVRPGEEVWRDEGLFPQRRPSSKHLLLPVTSSYQAFKGSMEQAISHQVHLLPTES